MFPSGSSPSNAYHVVGVETGVMAANPHKLVLMLYDGALLALTMAKQAMKTNKVAEKGEEISRAIEIITNGLMVSLDLQSGGEIATRLEALYEYMCNRLFQANLHNNPVILDEISGLLQELKGAWEEIAKDPAVVSDSRKLA